MKKNENTLYMGIVLMGFGIVMSGGMDMGPVGIVFMGVGAYFFIVGMRKRNKSQSKGEEKE